MGDQFFKRTSSENQVKDEYSKVAWFYDVWSYLTESKAAKKVIEIADIKDGESILEVAVGTGIVFKKILLRNPAGKNKGVDISKSMLSRAIKRLENFNARTFTLEIGSAYHLPYKDNAFDLIINNFMLDLLPEGDFDIVLSEFYRVLKPSGRTVISTMAFGSKWYHRFWRWIAREIPGLLTGCRPVSISLSLNKAGFRIDETIQISQNTFPAEVIGAMKVHADESRSQSS
jgi:ubiquinone/menaquinone biosynthesis C-methylase UbiE